MRKKGNFVFLDFEELIPERLCRLSSATSERCIRQIMRIRTINWQVGIKIVGSDLPDNVGHWGTLLITNLRSL